MVLMPSFCCSSAASSASSIRSPGMNRVTDRRTNPHLVTWSRSHELVDAASSAFRITLIEEGSSGYSTLRMRPPSTCTVAPVM